MKKRVKAKKMVCLGMAVMLAISAIQPGIVRAEETAQEEVMTQTVIPAIIDGESVEQVENYDEEREILATAKWGENINCILYEDGTLVISGTGEMYDMGNNSPSLSYQGDNLKNKVKHVVIESGVTNIAQWTFDGYRMLTDITIPDTVTSIGFNAFYNCIKLKNIKLPVNMSLIKSGTFANCKSLRTIEIPANTSEISTTAFINCDSLENISISEDNDSFRIYEDCLYNKDLSELIFIPASKKSLILSEQIESLGIVSYGRYAVFSHCKNLESISISENNSYYSTFDGCLYDKELSVLVACPSKKESIKLPEQLIRFSLDLSEYNNLRLIEVMGSETELTQSIYSYHHALQYFIVNKDSKAETYVKENNFKYQISGTTEIIDPYNVILESGKCGEDVSYQMNTDGVLTLSGSGEMYDYDMGIVSENALLSDFSRNTAIRQVIIEEGITRIGNNSFRFCGNLESVILPDSIKEIGSYAFSYCDNLETLKLPEKRTVSIENEAFYNCINLETVYVSAGTIGSSAFENDIRLCNLYLGDSVKSIGSRAFAKCIALEQIELPSGGEEYDDDAFWGCTNLKKVGWDSVAYRISISENVFRDCHPELIVFMSIGSLGKDSLESFGYTCSFGLGMNISYVLDENGLLTISGSGKTYSVNDYTEYFAGDESIPKVKITKVIIEEGITVIGDRFFVGCTNLSDVSLPDTISIVGEGAFWGCESLKEISLPNTISIIGADAFGNCKSLKEISLPNTLKSIEDFTFRDCGSLKKIEMSNEITSIGDGAFVDCKSLKKIEIPCKVTKIPYQAFYGCNSLSDILLGDGLEIIGEEAFCECSKLENMVIPNTVTHIGDRAFAECSSIENIRIPENVMSIGRNAFEECSSLKSIIIPENMTSIDEYAFSCCRGLTNIEIPNGITSICRGAFSDCSGLTNIEIPKGVAHIGEDAFYGCINLISIEIQEGVTSIGDTAFGYCSSLETITIPKSITEIGQNAIGYKYDREVYDYTKIENLPTIYCYADSAAYTYAIENEIPYVLLDEGSDTTKPSDNPSQSEKPSGNTGSPEGEKPSDTTNTPQTEKPSDSSTEQSTTPDTVKIVQLGACEYEVISAGTVTLTGLKKSKTKKLTIPKTITVNGIKYKVTAIADKAFKNAKITNLTIGSNVKTIGTSAFESCKSLTKMTIGSGVTKLGKNAFKNCKKLKTITIKSVKLKTVGKNAFKGIKSTAKIKVPKKKLTAYKKLFKKSGVAKTIKIVK